MTCNTCGAPVHMVDGSDFTGKGMFQEKYECANGHKGFISGLEEKPPNSWDKYGSVFE